MVLNNLQLINSDKVIDLRITGEFITGISDSHVANAFEAADLVFENAVVLPGLINSHDHLDFNLFPQLGTQVYNNYREWAGHIHKEYKEEIAAVLRAPEDLRVQWGIYKNLLCGVTTVVNHGKKLQTNDDLITVLQECESLHSVAFEKKLRLKLNNPFRINEPVAIHAGEGTDDFAANEIDELTKWNLLKRKLVGIHGVAMNVEQAKKFGALVWCPASNYFLFHKTADIRVLKEYTTICFGSDSTLTSNWNIWDHLNVAQRKTGITQNELVEMVTTNPAKIWKLNGGTIEEGRDADIVVTKMPTGGLFSNINPKEILLVIHKGEICLFDEALYSQMNIKCCDKRSFSAIEMSNSVKYVKGYIQQLITDIKRYFPKAQLPVGPVCKMVSV